MCLSQQGGVGVVEQKVETGYASCKPNFSGLCWATAGQDFLVTWRHGWHVMTMRDLLWTKLDGVM
jgi:hypothetical protein